MAGSNKKGARTEKRKVVEQNEKSPKKCQKGPVVVNGKTTPKGRRPKEPIKSPATQSQTREKEARRNSQGASVQTSTPVQLIVVSSPTQTNSSEQSVATPPKQSPAVINPNSLTAVVKELRDVAIANNNIEPMIDEIETEYQRRLALRCAEGLQLPPITIGVTSQIITHALNSGVGSLHMQPNSSRSVQTSVAPSHPVLVSLTNVDGVGHCSQSGSTQISNPVEGMHLDLELE